MNKILWTTVASVFLSASVQAATVSVFNENFESGLGAWTDRSPSNPQATIAIDPLNNTNHALSFLQRGSAGSIFSTNNITSNGTYTVSFDFLGLPINGSNTGGFFGISESIFGANPGRHQWIAGDYAYPAPIKMVSDGLWHHYSLTFNSIIGKPVHLMFEDYVNSDSTAGNVYFDNIRFGDTAVSETPEPASLALLGLGLAGLGVARRKRSV